MKMTKCKPRLESCTGKDAENRSRAAGLAKNFKGARGTPSSLAVPERLVAGGRYWQQPVFAPDLARVIIGVAGRPEVAIASLMSPGPT
jgi:hypothetical protein